MDKTKLAAAIKALVACKDFASRVDQIKHGTAALTGKAEVYLVLRDLAQRQPEQFDQIVTYCAAKRQPVPDRNEYQKQLMRQRRARMAAMLAQIERKQGAKLPPDERKRMELLVTGHWAEKRAAYLREHGTTNANIAQFWADIDRELGL